jgi:hypothetical protein
LTNRQLWTHRQHPYQPSRRSIRSSQANVCIRVHAHAAHRRFTSDQRGTPGLWITGRGRDDGKRDKSMDQASDSRAIGLIFTCSESKNGTAYILRSRRLHSAQLARETCDENLLLRSSLSLQIGLGSITTFTLDLDRQRYVLWYVYRESVCSRTACLFSWRRASSDNTLWHSTVMAPGAFTWERSLGSGFSSHISVMRDDTDIVNAVSSGLGFGFQIGSPRLTISSFIDVAALRLRPSS